MDRSDDRPETDPAGLESRPPDQDDLMRVYHAWWINMGTSGTSSLPLRVSV
jgi:hypothetical protein